MKLVNKWSGKEFEVGQTVHSFRGEVYTLDSWTEPHKEGSTGRIYVRQMGINTPQTFYPGVIDAEWRFNVGDFATLNPDPESEMPYPHQKVQVLTEYDNGTYIVDMTPDESLVDRTEVPSNQLVKYFP